jgi:hypothetical protein
MPKIVVWHRSGLSLFSRQEARIALTQGDDNQEKETKVRKEEDGIKMIPIGWASLVSPSFIHSLCDLSLTPNHLREHIYTGQI